MMKKLVGILVGLASILLAAGAHAQVPGPCPYPLAYGQVLTAAQWNACIGFGINALPLTGGTLTGPLITTPSTNAHAGINIPWGIAPTSPNNGDIWGTNGVYSTTNNGTTYNFVLGPTVAVNNHIAIFSGTTGALIQDSGTQLPASGTLVATSTGSPAQGDVLYYNGTTWTDLAAGASGTFLKANGALTNPTWSAVTAPAGTVIASVSPAAGDVLYYNAGAWNDLAHGTSGQLLQTNGAAAPSWVTVTATGCTISGGAQFNPIVNNGSNGCQNDTSALLNGQTLALGVSNASSGAILLNASGTSGSAQILGGTSASEMDLFTSTSSGLIKVGGNAGVELGFYGAGPTFANKLDYNVSNAGNWTFQVPAIFPSGGALIGTGSAYVALGFSGSGANTATFPQNTGTVAELNLVQTWTAAQTINSSDLKLAGASSGTTILNASATAAGTITLPAVTDTVGVLGTADQTMAGGVNLTSNNIGTVSSGTTTIDCGKNPSQYLTNNGAFTLAAPSNDGTCILEVINGASAGTITFSGWTEGSNTGDSLDTTNTHKFFLSLMRTNGTSHYIVSAAQ